MSGGLEVGAKAGYWTPENEAAGGAPGRLDLRLQPITAEQLTSRLQMHHIYGAGHESGAASRARSDVSGYSERSFSVEQREEIERDITQLHEIVSGPGMDSKKTQELTRVLPSMHPKVEGCFEGAGQWDSTLARFAGAPDWREIARALERLKDEIHHQHMTIELDLDEELIDAFATDANGMISFDQFAMLLAEADASG